MEFKVPSISLARSASKKAEAEAATSIATPRITDNSNPPTPAPELEEAPQGLSPKPQDASAEEPSTCSSSSSSTTTTTTTKQPSKEKEAVPDIPLSYNEPHWSATPSRPFFLTVIKQGSIIREISLSKKPFHVFGRLPSCDIQLEHPSISRHHAVIQYRPFSKTAEGGDSSPPPSPPDHMTILSVSTNPSEEGFYVYDLGSTHGSYINKAKIQPRCYYRLRLGQMVKFGGSSRLFLLECSSEDQGQVEAEAEEEIREIVGHKDGLKRRKEELEARQRLADKEKEDMGVMWGIVADDLPSEFGEGEDFEIDAEKEAYYIDDPKKALKKFFDREGLELEYETEEEGPPRARVFTVRVRLPIDTATGEAVCAEASLKGKKKDAVLQCALNACRMLDAQGMLRHHARVHKTQDRNWEEHDYYDSDEDTFLDRTGEIEVKRKRRMKKAGVLQDSAEKYETLEKRLEEMDVDISSIEKRLANDSKMSDVGESSNKDSLELYMSNIDGRLDKSKRLELKHQLHDLKDEKRRVLNLMRMVKKTNLPELISSPKADLSENGKNDSKDLSSISPSSSSGDKKDTSLSTKSDDGSSRSNNRTIHHTRQDTSHPQAMTPLQAASGEISPPAVSSKRKKRRLIGPSVLPPSPESSSTSDSHSSRDDKGQKTEDSIDYSDWLPPEKQTGDGKTYLNKKFGY